MENVEKGIQKIQIALIIGIAVLIFFKSKGVPFMGSLLVICGGIFLLLTIGLMIYSLASKRKFGKGIAGLLFFMNLTSFCAIEAILTGVMIWSWLSFWNTWAFLFFLGFVIFPGIIYYFIRGRNNPVFWKLLRFDLIKLLVLVIFAFYISSFDFDERIDKFSSDPAQVRENIKKNQQR
jgi:hypothetical protein